MIDGPPIRVLTVDDHPLMMDGITGVIDAERDMKVVGQTIDGESAVTAFRALRPDVTLMDLRMPKLNGIDAIVAIREEFAKAKIIVLTTSGGDLQALAAIKAGAMGYLLKNLVRTELVSTIRRIHAGHRQIPPAIAEQIAEHAGEVPITVRELDVLRGLADGGSNKVIAARLHITEHTVKGHLKSILAKLDASDRTQAVMIALKRGLLEL